MVINHKQCILKKLYIEQTDRTPEINFTHGRLRIWGTFVPLDPAGFNLPLHEWVKKYSITPASVTLIEIGIKYTRGYAMNYLKKLLQELILIKSDQHNVIINWHFSTNSIDVKAGEYISKKINHGFSFVEVEDFW